MIMADTGFWLALANKKDKYHLRAKECIIRFHEPFIMTYSCFGNGAESRRKEGSSRNEVSVAKPTFWL